MGAVFSARAARVIAVVGAALLLGALACGARSPSDEPRAGVSDLSALAAEVAKVPPGPPPPLHLDGPPLDLQHNAAFVQVEDLADLKTPVAVPLRLDATRFWTTDGWKDRIRYALVVRTVQAIPAALGPDGDVDPGLYQGDVLVFDLQTGVACGGVRFAADSASYVPAILPKDVADPGIRARVTDELRQDLAKRARDAAAKALGV